MKEYTLQELLTSPTKIVWSSLQSTGISNLSICSIFLIFLSNN